MGVGLNVTFIKFHAAAAQQFQILLAKRAREMMLRLLFDIMTNRFVLGSAYGEGAVTFLPCETMHPNLIVHPSGRNCL